MAWFLNFQQNWVQKMIDIEDLKNKVTALVQSGEDEAKAVWYVLENSAKEIEPIISADVAAIEKEIGVSWITKS